MNKFLQILKIVNGVTAAIGLIEERKAGASGTEKKAIVRDDVMAALDTVELVSGRDIADQKKFKKHMNGLIDNIVGLANATVWGKK